MFKTGLTLSDTMDNLWEGGLIKGPKSNVSYFIKKCRLCYFCVRK